MAKSKQKKNKQYKKKNPIIKLLVCVFAIAVFLGVSIFIWNYAINVNEEIIYSNVYTAEKQNLSEWISANGVVTSEKQTMVVTKSTQKIKKNHINVGDYVKKGDILVEFDGSELENELDKINESIKNIENYRKLNTDYLQGVLNDQTKLKNLQLEQMQRVLESTENIYILSTEKKNEYSALVETEEKNKVRYEELLSTETDQNKLLEYQQFYNNSLATLEIYQSVLNEYIENTEYYKQQLDEYKESYELLKHSMESEIISAQDNYNISLFADSTLETYRSEAKKLKNQLANLSIVAPNDGYITALYTNEGSTCDDGKVASIEDRKSDFVTAYVKNDQIDQVYIGMKVLVSADFSIGSEIEGTVTEVLRYSEDGTFPVKIVLKDSEQMLSGLSLSVRFIKNTIKNKICVPFDTVVQDESGSYVYKVVKGDAETHTLKKVPVKVLMKGSYYFAIKSNELSEGELVCGEAGNYTENDVIYISEKTTF